MTSRGRLASLRPSTPSESQWAWVGDANPSVLVAGHSHRNAYSAAIAGGLTSPGVGVAVLVARGPVDRSTPPQPDETYWHAACDTPGRVLAVVWQGNQHNARFLFGREPFRLHDCGEIGRVVPASLVSAVWEPSLDEIDAAVAPARAEHVVLLGTPPPKTDEAIRAGLPFSPAFRPLAAAGESADAIRITPAALRVALWKILQDDLEARAARIGAVFVPVPASAQTADGCLKPEYSLERDISHANGAFGAMMLGEIEASLARAEVPRS